MIAKQDSALQKFSQQNETNFQLMLFCALSFDDQFSQMSKFTDNLKNMPSQIKSNLHIVKKLSLFTQKLLKKKIQVANVFVQNRKKFLIKILDIIHHFSDYSSNLSERSSVASTMKCIQFQINKGKKNKSVLTNTYLSQNIQKLVYICKNVKKFVQCQQSMQKANKELKNMLKFCNNELFKFILNINITKNKQIEAPQWKEIDPLFKKYKQCENKKKFFRRFIMIAQLNKEITTNISQIVTQVDSEYIKLHQSCFSLITDLINKIVQQYKHFFFILSQFSGKILTNKFVFQQKQSKMRIQKQLINKLAFELHEINQIEQELENFYGEIFKKIKHTNYISQDDNKLIQAKKLLNYQNIQQLKSKVNGMYNNYFFKNNYSRHSSSKSQVKFAKSESNHNLNYAINRIDDNNRNQKLAKLNHTLSLVHNNNDLI